MSDLLKIFYFSLFLSILWIIPRTDLIFQWIISYSWYSGAIITSLVLVFWGLHWIKGRKSQRENAKGEELNIQKLEG
ncbi:hypothetical protein [Halalkalibacter krulwichiae]|uniref:hypothetical protein n=1 Tax=Halalkalibacter krulwichiae TaxID=199441 RepID=UPI000826F63E|nr:hypothetical protein [Halalkalibacter krulwichiae]